MTDELHPAAVAAAAYGLSHTAGKQGLNLHTYDVPALAENALRHALAGGHIVTAEHAATRLADETAKTARWRSSWAAAVGDRDRQLVRVQRALSGLAETDPGVAGRLAAEVGVLLLPAQPVGPS